SCQASPAGIGGTKGGSPGRNAAAGRGTAPGGAAAARKPRPARLSPGLASGETYHLPAAAARHHAPGTPTARPPRRHAGCPPALLAGALLACACAAKPAPSKVAEPAPDQIARLRAAEQLYRKDDPAFAAERDDLARDPVTAFWLTRLFVR